jgi:hypothetical protein
MANDYAQYDLIRRRVEARFSRRRWFINHVGLFFIVNLAIWAQVVFSGQTWFGNSILDRMIVTAAWLGILILHTINYNLSEQKDRAIQEEVEREHQRRLQLRNADSRRLHLSDEGELADDFHVWQPQEKTKRE